ncbi:RDD family protein [Luteolibacter luteus]|uniref:RDD family protein n=1 Tax=Luteolibacter luteus TaxID=2728835 RepID=A0A858RMN0_9BACT|nr:RDD family protein [Luteolibacter luteus]QJE97965.1 RDD family protein [Luteolibacter luteus]
MLYLTYRPANGFKRVMAYMIDVLPIFLLLYFASTKFFGINPFESGSLGSTPKHPAAVVHLVIAASAFTLWVFYCALAELSPWRGTYGKVIMGIRVRGLDRDNHSLNLKQVSSRNAAKFLSAIPCFLGFFAAFFTNGNRAWHDSLSKTAVAER